jgi:hypothetical protein
MYSSLDQFNLHHKTFTLYDLIIKPKPLSLYNLFGNMNYCNRCVGNQCIVHKYAKYAKYTSCTIYLLILGV